MAGSLTGTVRNRMNAAIIAMCAVAVGSAASAAPLLCGHVKEDAPLTPSSMQAGVAPSAQSVPLMATAREERKDPFGRFQGTWQAITLVTDSLVPSVTAGQRVVSTMEFAQSNDGHLYAKWEQPGWRESQASVTVTSNDSFMIDRTSYYFGDRNNAWATHSRDSYSLLEGNKVLATSEVDQYIDGRYVGRYCTKSVLIKVSDATSIALGK